MPRSALHLSLECNPSALWVTLAGPALLSLVLSSLPSEMGSQCLCWLLPGIDQMRMTWNPLKTASLGQRRKDMSKDFQTKCHDPF